MLDLDIKACAVHFPRGVNMRDILLPQWYMAEEDRGRESHHLGSTSAPECLLHIVRESLRQLCSETSGERVCLSDSISWERKGFRSFPKTAESLESEITTFGSYLAIVLSLKGELSRKVGGRMLDPKEGIFS